MANILNLYVKVYSEKSIAFFSYTYFMYISSIISIDSEKTENGNRNMFFHDFHSIEYYTGPIFSIEILSGTNFGYPGKEKKIPGYGIRVCVCVYACPFLYFEFLFPIYSFNLKEEEY